MLLPADLLARAGAGDAAALTVLYRHYAADLIAALGHLLGSRAEAEDAVQDLFVALPEALGSYVERGQFGAWLRRVAVRLALARLRTRARRREAPLDAGVDAARSLPARHTADGVIDRVALERALAALPNALRVVFLLKEVEGYSHAEIAASLGITRAASEVRLFRAVRRLRDHLS